MRRIAAARGVTLVEMLMAVAILAIVATAVSALGTSAQQAWLYGQEQGTATQHARVVLQRIAELVATAHSTPSIPGVAILYEDVGGTRYYDTLVVWRGEAAQTSPDGPPLVSECTIICVDPDDPTQLVEITAPGDSREINVEDTEINKAVQRAVIDDVKTSPSSTKTLLTDRLRAPRTSIGGSRRGAIQFASVQMPSRSELNQYDDGLVAWDDLSWPQDRYGEQTGMRQYRLRIELQLMPSRDDAVNETNDRRAMLFLGSAAHFFRIDRTGS